MTRTLTLAVAQPLSVSHDLDGNARRHAEAIRTASARVVVFPEMSLTGYEFDAAVVDPPDERLRPIVEACRETSALAFAGAPVDGPGGGASIGMLRLDAGGACIAYRKMWLGDAERRHFRPGDQPAVVDVDGWRLALAICKDTGEPQHAEMTAALGIDVYVAGALEHDRDREVQPDRARRIATTHGVWVAVAGFAGATGEGYERTAGRSAIWRPDGSVAAHAGPDPGEVVGTEIYC